MDIGTEPLCMELYLDHSMLEVYVNQRKSVTLRNYAGAEWTVRSLELICDPAIRIGNLEVWEMEAAL